MTPPVDVAGPLLDLEIADLLARAASIRDGAHGKLDAA